MNRPTPEHDPELDIDWWASRLVDREIDFADVPADLRSAVQDKATAFATQRRTLLRLGQDHHVDATVTEVAMRVARRSPDASIVPIRRRLAPLLAVAAATVGVVGVGVAILQPDDSPDVVAFESVRVAESIDLANDKVGTPEVAVPAADAEVLVDDSSAAMAIEGDDAGSADVVDSTTEDVTIDDRSSAPMPTDVVEIADMIELADVYRSWADSPPPALEGDAACDDDLGRPALAINIRFAGIDAQAFYSPESGVMLLAVSDCLKLASIVP